LNSEEEIEFGDEAKRFHAVLSQAKRVLVTSHRRPDGDGMGSMSALKSILTTPNRTVILYSPDPPSKRYSWLPHVAYWKRSLLPTESFDITIVVDCADPALLTDVLPEPARCGTVVTMDHHARGRRFGDISLFAENAPAVAVLIVRLSHGFQWTISKDAATALYVSLVSDTGWFRHANTNAEALSVGADLVTAGALPQEISASLEERPSLVKAKLNGLALSRLQQVCEGRAGLLVVDRKEVEAIGATWEDTNSLVNWTRGISGVSLGVMIAVSEG